MLATVQRNEPGGRKRNKNGLNKKKLQGRCEVLMSQEGEGVCVAGQMPEGRVGDGGWEWSKAAHHHISLIFFLNHSLHHTTRHCFFFSDWDMQGHQKLRIDQ